MLAPPEWEDFSRRGGNFLRFKPMFFRVACTSAQRWLLRRCRAHTRSRSKKPHTAATRASRRGAGARPANRVDNLACSILVVFFCHNVPPVCKNISTYSAANKKSCPGLDNIQRSLIAVSCSTRLIVRNWSLFRLRQIAIILRTPAQPRPDWRTVPCPYSPAQPVG